MDVPPILTRRLRQGRVIPFVGAGVSMAVHRKDGTCLFPSWKDLLLLGAARLASEVGEKHGQLVRLVLEVDGDYLGAARRLQQQPGDFWIRFLRDELDPKREDVDDESLALARAVWSLGGRLVVTTNYDRVLEWACPDELRGDLDFWDIEAVAEQARLLQEGAATRPTAWHLHGRIGNTADLILTTDGYQRLYGSDRAEERYRAARATLRHLLTSHSFLFVGFSLDDASFAAELKGVRELYQGSSATHYALVRAKDEKRVRDLGVMPILYEDRAALPALVEEIGRQAAAPADASAPAVPDEPPPPDWTAYLDSVIDQTGHVEIRGISTSSSVEAPRHPIERLYTPLRSRGFPHRLEDAERGAAAEGFEASGSEASISLAELLPRHDRLLIEGQPGAGKTTFLRFVAAMLGRDAAGRPCPDGTSWRQVYLGLDDTEPPPIPVFVRLADLVPLLEKRDTLRQDDRRWLLDFLERTCSENDFSVSRDAWQDSLEGGTALLLLDGLDEVADETLRVRLFDVFRDACRRWRCPMVVTSRPISTGELRDMGFRLATIEPFGDAEIGVFLDHWVTALHAAGSVKELGGEGEKYRRELHQAITERPRVRRLATNPVMLTCLCVVHWNEGRLPEGRSRVYGAVVRWLLVARKAQRKEAGYGDRFAHRALARLALAMMCAEGGRRTVLDLEAAAVAVDAMAERELPDVDAQERRHRSRDWLRFECLGSGLVEEVAGNRVRFWHLTFQEYLAALELAWRGDGKDPASDWWPVVEGRLDDAQWRETVELLPGCLFDEGGEGRVDRLLTRVLRLRGEDPELAEEARVAGIVGRLLQPLSVYGYRVRPEVASVYEESLERSMAPLTGTGFRRRPAAAALAFGLCASPASLESLNP